MASDSKDTTTQSLISTIAIPTLYCFNMQELLDASVARAQASEILSLIQQDKHLSPTQLEFQSTHLYTHLSYGLAYTTGSALGYKPPTTAVCLAAFQIPNRVGLTVGARAWTKHAHRSQCSPDSGKPKPGWWGLVQGPIKVLNERAYILFCKVLDNASWRNLHMLPHAVLAYEIRVPEGYGMRWSQDLNPPAEEAKTIGSCNNENAHGPEGGSTAASERPWIFRGFLEPMIENGHEVGWRHHPIDFSVPVDASEMEKSSAHST